MGLFIVVFPSNLSRVFGDDFVRLLDDRFVFACRGVHVIHLSFDVGATVLARPTIHLIYYLYILKVLKY